MSGDDLESMDDELSALLREERRREPVSPDVSARIRDHVAKSVGLGVGLGVASGVKAAASSTVKAGVSSAAVSSTSVTTIGAAGALVAPKALAIVGALIVAGGLSAIVATTVLTPQPVSVTPLVAKPVVERATASRRKATEAVLATRTPEAVEVVAPEAELLAAPGVVPPVVDPPKDAAGEASRDRSLAAERELVSSARDAVAGRDWTTALSLLEQHRRKFNRGRLAEERESLRVPVLVMLGRNEDARAAAQRFHARYPTSIFATGVDQAVRSIP